MDREILVQLTGSRSHMVLIYYQISLYVLSYVQQTNQEKNGHFSREVTYFSQTVPASSPLKIVCGSKLTPNSPVSY